MFWSKPNSKVRKLEKRVLDLESETDALRREIKVIEHERDALACVIVRDRERVQSETSHFIQRAVENE